MRAVRFVKVEGAGNDYVLVEEFDRPVEDPYGLSRAVSDRHAGVGSDGLLLVGPARAPAVARMRIFNADGTEPEISGNGLRCASAYLYHQKKIESPQILFSTSVGERANSTLINDRSIGEHPGWRGRFLTPSSSDRHKK